MKAEDNQTKNYLKSKRIVLKDEIIEGIIEVRNKRIHQIHPYDYKVEICKDYGDQYLAPGLIDIHTHGFAGYSFTSVITSEDLDVLSNIYLREGVTSLLATSSNDAIKIVSEKIDTGLSGAEILGIHVEGPFLSQHRSGAAPKGTVFPKPDMELMKEILKDSNNNLSMVTIAPELEGSDEIIDLLKKENVIVAAGHTEASYELLEQKKADIDILTHLGNAMSGIHHRNMGAFGYGLNKSIYVELITDGRHLSKSMLEIIFKIKNIDEIIIISDSIALGGCKKGKYQTATDNYIVDSKGTIINNLGNLSGSSFSLLSNLRYLHKNFNFNVDELFTMASLNPSKLLAVDKNYGSIDSGKYADIIVLDDNFDIVDVYKKGKLLYDKNTELVKENPQLAQVLKNREFLNFYSTKEGK